MHTEFRMCTICERGPSENRTRNMAWTWWMRSRKYFLQSDSEAENLKRKRKKRIPVKMVSPKYVKHNWLFISTCSQRTGRLIERRKGGRNENEWRQDSVDEIEMKLILSIICNPLSVEKGIASSLEMLLGWLWIEPFVASTELLFQLSSPLPTMTNKSYWRRIKTVFSKSQLRPRFLIYFKPNPLCDGEHRRILISWGRLFIEIVPFGNIMNCHLCAGKSSCNRIEVKLIEIHRGLV